MFISKSMAMTYESYESSLDMFSKFYVKVICDTSPHEVPDTVRMYEFTISINSHVWIRYICEFTCMSSPYLWIHMYKFTISMNPHIWVRHIYGISIMNPHVWVRYIYDFLLQVCMYEFAYRNSHVRVCKIINSSS